MLNDFNKNPRITYVLRLYKFNSDGVDIRFCSLNPGLSPGANKIKAFQAWSIFQITV